MNKDRQIELLNELATKRRVLTKEEAITLLQSANIIDENGEISSNYPELKKYYEISTVC